MKKFHATWSNIRRSPYQALAAVLIMTLTFASISSFTFLLLGSAKIIKYLESKPQVTAFFRNEVKQQDINDLEVSLRQQDKIAKVKFVSKEEALKIYREQNKDDPLLLDLVTAETLPSSLEISTIKIEDLNVVYGALKNSPLISEVVFQKDVVSTLINWTNSLRKIGIGLITFLALISIFVMTTIIGIKISQKKGDIEIIKLIGGTNWYIRWPFIFEGMFYGAVGAFVGWGVVSSSLWYFTPFLSSFLKGIPLFPVHWLFLVSMLGLELLLAVFLGALSSFLAVLRYLK